MEELERVVALLQSGRRRICETFSPEPVLADIAPCPANAVAPVAVDPNNPSKFVASSHRIAGNRNVGKVHAVAVGPPDDLRFWKSKCGWHFGRSPDAKPVHSLPNSWKLICERCCPSERASARLIAETAVTEVVGAVS